MFANPRQPLFSVRRHPAAFGACALSVQPMSLIIVLVLITCAGAG